MDVITASFEICKPQVDYRFNCMVLYHSQARRHVIKDLLSYFSTKTYVVGSQLTTVINRFFENANQKLNLKDQKIYTIKGSTSLLIWAYEFFNLENPVQFENQIKPRVYIRRIPRITMYKKLHSVSRNWHKVN